MNLKYHFISRVKPVKRSENDIKNVDICSVQQVPLDQKSHPRNQEMSVRKNGETLVPKKIITDKHMPIRKKYR